MSMVPIKCAHSRLHAINIEMKLQECCQPLLGNKIKFSLYTLVVFLPVG